MPQNWLKFALGHGNPKNNLNPRKTHESMKIIKNSHTTS